MTTHVALIGLPELAASFRDAGFDVAGGTSVFKKDANEIRAAVVNGDTPVLLVADTQIIGLKAWLGKMAAFVPTFILRTQPSGGLAVEGASSIDLPRTFGELLTAVGLPAVDESTGSLVITVEGTVQAAPEPSPFDDIPLFDEDDEDDTFGSPVAAPDTDTSVAELEANEERQRAADAEARAREEREAAEAAESAESERLQAAEEARLRAERQQKEEAERKAAEEARSRAERERQEQEALRRAEAERLERERAEAERLERERAEAERLERERAEEEARKRAEAERLERERQRAEAERLEQEALRRAEEEARKRAEAERLERERQRAEEVRREAEDAAAPWDEVPAPPPLRRKPVVEEPEAPWDTPSEATPTPREIQPNWYTPPTGGETRRTDPTAPPVIRRPSGNAEVSEPTRKPVVEPEPEVAEFDFEQVVRSSAPTRPGSIQRSRPKGIVLASVSGKGGVGKSSFANSLATALATAGLSVCLIDCNRGQGDQRRFLRMKRAGVDGAPTIYDAAIGAMSYEDVILTPEMSSALRPQLLAPLTFSVVLAPPDHLADPEVVDTEVYSTMVETARANYDFVVLDTQIVEATDTSGLIDGLVIPLLVDGGWVVGLTDPSTPGVENLTNRLRAFCAAGVPADRVMIVLNRVGADLTIDDEQFGVIYAGLGSYMGHVEESSLVKNAMNAGDSPYTLPQLAPMIDAICFKVTGRPELDPARHERGKKKRGFFGRRKKGR